jgi:hypothetical protein
MRAYVGTSFSENLSWEVNGPKLTGRVQLLTFERLSETERHFTGEMALATILDAGFYDDTPDGASSKHQRV